ncbi:MAG TPA: nucleotide exchange factor GrpE [Methylomirabilota bacterium]|jgi:molecular chaperone GrpE
MSDDDLDPDTDALSLTPEEEIRRLREALEAKTLLAEEHRDRYLRGAAEFDNARKRAAREREEYTRYANESLLRELLPVLDNFERALQSARIEPTAAAVTAGVELIQRELLRVLEKFGVTSFTSVGQPFDPERHEAIARVPAQGQPEGTVVDETARGYLLNGRVLRPAMVTVASSPDSS